jgi:hypothetical protein
MSQNLIVPAAAALATPGHRVVVPAIVADAGAA